MNGRPVSRQSPLPADTQATSIAPVQQAGWDLCLWTQSDSCLHPKGTGLSLCLGHKGSLSRVLSAQPTQEQTQLISSQKRGLQEFITERAVDTAHAMPQDPGSLRPLLFWGSGQELYMVKELGQKWPPEPNAMHGCLLITLQIYGHEDLNFI